MNNLISFTPLVGLFGLICALTIFVINDRRPPGNAKMREISQAIHDGAMAFLKREYTILIAFVIVVAVLIGWQLNRETAICFVSGAACSILAGFIGMKSATRANTRTCEAARSEGVGAALMVAFRGGAVIGTGSRRIGATRRWHFRAGVRWDRGSSLYQRIRDGGQFDRAICPRWRRNLHQSGRRWPAIWLAKWKPVSPKTIRVIRASSPTTWEITLAMWLEWEPTSLNPTSVR